MSKEIIESEFMPLKRIAELERERTLLFDAVGNLTYHAEMWEEKARNGRKRIAELETELAYLRWFHSSADFGPAHTDVVMAMQAAYPGTVPVTWLYE